MENHQHQITVDGSDSLIKSIEDEVRDAVTRRVTKIYGRAIENTSLFPFMRQWLRWRMPVEIKRIIKKTARRRAKKFIDPDNLY